MVRAWIVAAGRRDIARARRWLASPPSEASRAAFVDVSTGIVPVTQNHVVVLLQPGTREAFVSVPDTGHLLDIDAVWNDLVETARPMDAGGRSAVIHDLLLARAWGGGQHSLPWNPPRSNLEETLDRLTTRDYRSNPRMVMRLCETELRRSPMAEPIAEIVQRFLSRVRIALHESAPGLSSGPHYPDLFGEIETQRSSIALPGLALLRCWALPLIFETDQDIGGGHEGSPFRKDRLFSADMARHTVRRWIAGTYRNKVVPFARTVGRGADRKVSISLVSEFEQALGEVVLGTPSPPEAAGEWQLFPHMDGHALTPSGVFVKPGETAIFDFPGANRAIRGKLSLGLLTPSFTPANVVVGTILLENRRLRRWGLEGRLGDVVL